MTYNLHAMVRGMIQAVNPDQTVTLYRSLSMADDYRTDDEGRPVQGFETVAGVSANIQSESPTALYFADHLPRESVTRKAYLYANEDWLNKPFTGLRAFARGGDFVQMEDGTLWFIDSVMEDFSHVGWVSVRLVLQIEVPQALSDYLATQNKEA